MLNFHNENYNPKIEKDRLNIEKKILIAEGNKFVNLILMDFNFTDQLIFLDPFAQSL